MLTVLVMLLILLIVAGVCAWAVGQLPLAPPWNKVAQAVVVLIFVLVALGVLFGSVPVPTFPRR